MINIIQQYLEKRQKVQNGLRSLRTTFFYPFNVVDFFSLFFFIIDRSISTEEKYFIIIFRLLTHLKKKSVKIFLFLILSYLADGGLPHTTGAAGVSGVVDGGDIEDAVDDVGEGVDTDGVAEMASSIFFMFCSITASALSSPHELNSLAS